MKRKRPHKPRGDLFLTKICIAGLMLGVFLQYYGSFAFEDASRFQVSMVLLGRYLFWISVIVALSWWIFVILIWDILDKKPWRNWKRKKKAKPPRDLSGYKIKAARIKREMSQEALAEMWSDGKRKWTEMEIHQIENAVIEIPEELYKKAVEFIRSG